MTEALPVVLIPGLLCSSRLYAAQIPALFETLSGMPLSDLFSKVRAIGDKAPKQDEKK